VAPDKFESEKEIDTGWLYVVQLVIHVNIGNTVSILVDTEYIDEIVLANKVPILIVL
jgi:hypothetical protein